MQVLQGTQGRAGDSPGFLQVNSPEYGNREIATGHSASDVNFFPESSEPALEQLIRLSIALNKSAFVHGTSRMDRSIRPSGPIQFIAKLLEFWNLDRLDASRLLGFEESDADYVDRILEGTELLRGRDVRKRISHLFWIRKSLRSLFRDLEVENQWLRESHVLLDGRSPMSLLLAGSMDDLELTREYVDTVAGR